MEMNSVVATENDAVQPAQTPKLVATTRHTISAFNWKIRKIKMQKNHEIKTQ